jgi:hypothetical protein
VCKPAEMYLVGTGGVRPHAPVVGAVPLWAGLIIDTFCVNTQPPGATAYESFCSESGRSFSSPVQLMRFRRGYRLPFNRIITVEGGVPERETITSAYRGRCDLLYRGGARLEMYALYRGYRCLQSAEAR